MKCYGALDDINYDTLQLNKHKLQSIERPEAKAGPPSLLQICCNFICMQEEALLEEVIISVPFHLAEPLLRTAMCNGHSSAVAAFIASWPLRTLCFRDLLPEDMKMCFKEEMGRDLDVFKGVTARKKKCKMKCLDLRGFALNWTFTKLVVQMWPLLSLKHTQRNVKRLTNLVLKVAGLKRDNKLAKEIIPRMIKDLIGQEMTAHPRFGIRLPRGERMVVKIDRLEFGTQNTFFMDYLLTNCLRSITPVYVTASNIIIKSDLNMGDEVLDSLAPFIVFRGHDTETLEGIWLENLEDNVFFITHQDLHRFDHLTGLALPNCNVTLQEGRTRRRTATRALFTSTLANFPSLVRLDISQNCFAGCLQEVLEAVSSDLQYLCLRECDLTDKDIEYLASSRHANSMRQLNVSKICGLFPEDNFAVSTTTLVRSLANFSQLSLCHMQQNQITDSKTATVCSNIRNHWHCIKSLNISDNILSKDAVLEIVQACVKSKNLQLLTIPYSHNLLEAMNVMEHGRMEFSNQVEQILADCGRGDLEVKIYSLAYAVFANI